MITTNHAPLLERQAAIPRDLAKTPATIALLVIEQDLLGCVEELSARYDNMETPSEVGISVTESGILDDDLHAVRHVVALARNSNNQWRIVGYTKGELRRRHVNP